MVSEVKSDVASRATGPTNPSNSRPPSVGEVAEVPLSLDELRIANRLEGGRASSGRNPPHRDREAREVSSTFQWETEGDKQKIEEVLKAFQQYCELRKNALFKRFLFYKRQQDGFKETRRRM